MRRRPGRVRRVPVPARTTHAGVFGAKVHWDQLQALTIEAGGDPLEALFPGAAYVRIRRRDRDRQAVSLWRAMQDGIWSVAEDEPVPRERAAVPYSFEGIARCRGELAEADAAWDAYLAARGIVPAEVEHEELVADYAGTIARIAALVTGSRAPATASPGPPHGAWPTPAPRRSPGASARSAAAIVRPVADLAQRLAARTLELIDIPSESRDEARLAAHVADVLGAGGVSVRDLGARACWPGRATPRSCSPATSTRCRRRTTARAGRGRARARPRRVRHEGRRRGDDRAGAGRRARPLPVLRARGAARPRVRAGAAAGARAARRRARRDDGADRERVHAGCLGNINATWTFHGRSGHSARPWLADNAIERAAAGVQALAAHARAARVRRARVRRSRDRHADRRRDRDERDPRPRECHVDFRYAPGRSPAEAEARLPSCARPRRAADRRERASGPVAAGPAVDALVAAGGLTRAPKQAWTPVAEFGQAGLDAVNFGPGEPAQAHRRESPWRSPRSCAPTRCWSGSRHEARPRAHRDAHVPVRPARRGEARLLAAGVDLIDFGMGEPREETPAFIREALAAAVGRSPPTPRRRGCRSCARRSRRGSSGASAPA